LSEHLEHSEHAHDHAGHSHGAHAGHSHHGGGHAHAPASYGAAFAIGVALNGGFVLAEVVFGLWGHSVALLADAGHNLGDVLGLLVAWGAGILMRRAPSARFTYGLRGSSILAALFNAVVLLVTVGGIAWEAIRRFADPQPVSGPIVVTVALAGIVINGVTAWLFVAGRKDDLNLRGAFLHMAADALVSAGVVVAGLLIMMTGWLWLDPVVSLVISAVIVIGTWGLLRDSVAMAVAAVPAQIDPAEVRRLIERQPGVASLHDLHIWPMSTADVALTCHLLMPGGHPGDAFLHGLCEQLARRFKITHATVQIEVDAELACALAPEDVV
jgi:cobalt-zinc-cadmium efflux system protein